MKLLLSPGSACAGFIFRDETSVVAKSKPDVREPFIAWLVVR